MRLESKARDYTYRLTTERIRVSYFTVDLHWFEQIEPMEFDLYSVRASRARVNKTNESLTSRRHESEEDFPKERQTVHDVVAEGRNLGRL